MQVLRDPRCELDEVLVHGYGVVSSHRYLLRGLRAAYAPPC
jgi:hypothetical protein